jgi:Bacterial mobilisation protein (MobC)
VSAHGSNKRHRSRVLSARFNEREVAAVREMAERHGQSVGTLLRKTLLGIPAPARSVRRPSVDTQLVVKLLAELGKIGSNVNQIAKHLNAGRPGDTVENLIAEAMRDLLEMRHGCMQALGYEPDRGRSSDSADEPA